MGKVKAAPVVPGSNWKTLLKTLKPQATNPAATGTNTSTLKRKRSDSAQGSPAPAPKVDGKGKGKEKARRDSDDEKELDDSKPDSVGSKKRLLDVEAILAGGTQSWQTDPGQYLAIDCEMVGVGPEGSESTLARVSIVNYHGAVVLDRFVRPREKVTDYRTWVSGVREEDLRNAPSFVVVQREVADLIKDRILIGHAISNDTQVLLLSHPRHLTRDTANYAPLQGLAKTKRPGLKSLSKLVLGVDIQSGEHSSVDDARATMAVYRSQKAAWESSLKNHTKPALLFSTAALQTYQAELLSGTSSTTKSVITGVTKSSKPKTLGLAATLRHARNEREREEELLSVKLDEEGLEERERKKREREEKDGLILGFDYTKPVKVAKVVEERGKKKVPGKESDDKEVKVKKVRKIAGRAFKGDREKRPKSQEGWWDEA